MGMKIYWIMALRNLRRHTRRSLLTISGMAAGFAVLLWLQCILKGTNQQIVDNVTSTQVGHLQIWKKEYIDEPLIQKTYQPKIESLRKLLPTGSRLSERVHLPSLASSGEQSAPIMLEGIQPGPEAEVTKIKRNLVDGEYLSNGDDAECTGREIYMGRALADLLKVRLGDKIVILSQASDGSLGNELLRVRGLFDTGSKTFDRGVAYAPIGCVRKIGAIEGDHEVTIQLSNETDLVRVEKLIRENLSEIGDNLEITTWKKAVPALAGIVSFNDATLLLVSLVLFGVTTFGIVNTLLMSVFERTREFGVMLALGVSPSGVSALVLIEAILIGCFAALIGTTLGVIWVFYHQNTGFDLTPFLGDASALSVSQFSLETIVYPIFSFGRYITLCLGTILIATVAGTFPAIHAAKMNVIDAIRTR